MTVPGTPRTAQEEAEISLGWVRPLGRMNRWYAEAEAAYGRGEWDRCVSLCETAQDRGDDMRVKYEDDRDDF